MSCMSHGYVFNLFMCSGTTKNEAFHSYLKNRLSARGNSHRMKFRHMRNLVRLYIWQYNQRSSERKYHIVEGVHLDCKVVSAPQTTILQSKDWSVDEEKELQDFRKENRNIGEKTVWTAASRQELLVALLENEKDMIHTKDAIHWIKHYGMREHPKNKTEIKAMLRLIERGIRKKDPQILKEIDEAEARLGISAQAQAAPLSSGSTAAVSMSLSNGSSNAP